MALKGDKTRILVNIPVELKKEIEVLAADCNRSVSNYIVNLLQETVKKEKKAKK